MIEKTISWCIHHRFIVVVVAIIISIYGTVKLLNTPVDAIPDLSVNQVIVFTEWMGRNPQIMENQVTYPLVSNLQGIPKVTSVRGASMFGMSFIFIVFDDDVDIYWARTRVLEKLNYAQKSLPTGITPSLGPDGTGVGHVFWYTLEASGYDLAELRALQDWYIKFALQNTQGVSEVASYGGLQKQYQISIDPHKLNYYGITLMDAANAVRANNNDVGGRVFENNDMGYVIHGKGYIENIDEIKNIPVGSFNSIPITVKDIATVQMGGDLRLGIVEENGEGEKVGGIVVMRYGENAKQVIERVKAKLADVSKGLPPGVKFKVAYDRSSLIDASIETLKGTLKEEMIIVSIIIIIFLFHIRSSLVVIVMLPVAILISFILMSWIGITSNIMSLSGIAIAIGVIVDAAIVMVENTYRHLSDAQIEKEKTNV